MTESRKHKDLVKEIMNYCEKKLTKDQFVKTAFDHDDSELKPPLIYNSCPDAYLNIKELCLIGEAKTTHDYQTNHSMEQYISYFKFLKDKENPMLIFSCDWPILKSFKGLIYSLLRNNKYELTSKDIIFLKKTNL